jgi:LacI family transcriptional regulator
MHSSTVRLLINTTSGYGRATIRGVARYARQQGPWTLILDPVGLGVPRHPLSGMRIDGVIARIATRAVRGAVRQLGHVPVVDISEAFANLPYAKVISDPESVGRLAFEHLRSCGFSRFAFCGFTGQRYSRQRERAFVDAVAALGFTCDSFRADARTGGRSYRSQLLRLSRWLSDFDEPVGVFACNDWCGQRVLQACLLADLPVPQQIGVLGADNDEVVCETCHVPLSSIDIGTETIGYRAAVLLEALMGGEEPPDAPQRVGRCRVVPRASSDVLQVEDALIRSALQRMRTPGMPPRSIGEVLEALPVSRRPFEKRFRKAVGRSPYAELQDCRIRLGKQLLRSTDLPIGEIAERCGYALPHHFSAAFRRIVGITPTAFRRR